MVQREHLGPAKPIDRGSTHGVLHAPWAKPHRSAGPTASMSRSRGHSCLPERVTLHLSLAFVLAMHHSCLESVEFPNRDFAQRAPTSFPTDSSHRAGHDRSLSGKLCA